MRMMHVMRIPIDRLSPDTLRNVVSEYVTRDGTELSDVEMKIDQVIKQLRAGRAELHLDEESETTTILPVDRK